MAWNCLDTCEVEWRGDAASGKLLHVNEYDVVGRLGAGSFGQVLEVERGDRRFALKVFSRSKLKRVRTMGRAGTGVDAVQREIAIQRSLYHRNVVILFEVLDDFGVASDEIGLVLELCSFGPCMTFIPEDCRFRAGAHGSSVRAKLGDSEVEGVDPAGNDSLRALSEALDVPTAASYFRDLMQGLEYLHGPAAWPAVATSSPRSTLTRV